MERVAKFYKVSFQQYKEAYIDTYGEASDETIKEVYDEIKLPKRATSGSA